ncbi:MAG: hypothetical protein HFH73_04085 [Lachnospiraceae bacterium]|jgi:uncharacterized protein YvpB|nr:hypothetical protein [Lachnospiraceae bacterium]
MGSIAQKLQYMNNAVDDIQLAINEMGVETDDSTELGYYGDKIREIANTNGNNIKDFYHLEKFEGFSKLDLTSKNFIDISDLVIVGKIDDLDSLDCITLDSFTAYNTSNITPKTIEDVSDAYQF